MTTAQGYSGYIFLEGWGSVVQYQYLLGGGVAFLGRVKKKVNPLEIISVNQCLIEQIYWFLCYCCYFICKEN